jgi:hypothetical protein
MNTQTCDFHTTGGHQKAASNDSAWTKILGLFSIFAVLILTVAQSGCVGLAGDGPSILAQPSSQTVTMGHPATFSVKAAGTAPLVYQWSKNGAAIAGATLPTYTTPATTTSFNGVQFSVAVSDLHGVAKSVSAILTVTATPTAPSISSQPSSQTVKAGQTATFSVTATGTSPLSYQWSKNGAAIAGAIGSSYVTPATVASDNGAQFIVVITNGTGTATSSPATLTVTAAPTAPPSITGQPSSQTEVAGQTATFSVTATGTTPLSYQWSKNGAAIAGGTAASYTTPATTTSDNGGQFTVTVSDAAGNVTSNTATLTVNPATLILNANKAGISFGDVHVGSNSTLSVTFTNTGNSSVAVSNVSVSGAGFAASGIPTGQTVPPGQTATLNVIFTPSAASGVTGSITVTSNATNSPTTISLSGTGGQAVPPSVALSWTDSATSLSGYNVYRSSVSGGSYSKLDSALVTTTQYVDSTVQAGQTYYYVVTSVNSSGEESAYSNVATATVPSS